MFSVKVTCFTLYSNKSWCTAAVECVHSVCAGPVVLTGMTCTVIDICFKECGRTLITVIFDKTCNNNNNATKHGNPKNIFQLAKQHSKKIKKISSESPKYMMENRLVLAIVTCFTLSAIKSWCAAAVECVHSVCAGPVVLTGMTCTVIDIFFKETS